MRTIQAFIILSALFFYSSTTFSLSKSEKAKGNLLTEDHLVFLDCVQKPMAQLSKKHLAPIQKRKVVLRFAKNDKNF